MPAISPKRKQRAAPFKTRALDDAGEWLNWEAIAALKVEAERKLGELERAGV